MAQVIFYEKPGCVGNARQRAVLTASGHALDRRDILSAGWTAETLRPFFGDRPVAEWVNASAPRVKSGEIRPEALSEAEAMDLMLADPLLIRRPLMQVGEARMAGFDQAAVADWIGLAPTRTPVTDACPRQPDAPSCPPPEV
ncbi:ArsC/Spx/MgsR family protein [Rhodovulum visakhapatnamense]|uniref:Nitrogenase-associated protein n=1 Tax=Rhodovulum visakhapatnamense TaxID=364297 RepID=A0A4R8G1S9_9RHOB|nr:ArsC/Spx/MgsR family protein [Rhodovulum visakhapatnamense]TDX31987.1 nitrogenase-associated protein [Rhodovulum visakhapatnamense]